MHVFQIAAPMVPEADRSLRQIGNFIREATDPYQRKPVCTARAPRPRRDAIAYSHLKAVAADRNSPSNWR
jgi:hypothetical protein